jgi:hypothetical protein
LIIACDKTSYKGWDEMPYIIDRVKLVKNRHVFTYSILVDGNQIRYKDKNFDHLSFMRMDGSKYLMTPGYIFLDFSLPISNNFQHFKQVMKEKFILKGCTTIVSIISVQYERQLEKRLREQRKYLLNSPIDYLIGIMVPLKKLTPNFIRLCKRLKIPLIMILIHELRELDEVQWGWIRDALFPQQIPFFPKIKQTIQPNMFKKKWNQIVKTHKFSSILDCPKEHQPLSKDILMKIGLYPERGEIHVGGKVNYNLYRYEKKIEIVEENALVDYDKHIPEIIVHNGTILKAGERIFFRSGAGQEIVCSLPGRFRLDSTPIQILH